jgi:5-methyltetrahydropteroyltriglutamate--homocysteine methyltransferase
MAQRILTTHVGSLPRPPSLVQMMWDLIDGKDVDPVELDREIVEAIRGVVRRQLELGIDEVSDGEMSKIGFNNYINERLAGFGGSAVFAASDLGDFPELAARLFANDAGAHIPCYRCVGPIELKDGDAVHRDIARFKDALGDHDPANAFMSTVTPGQITFNHPNEYYGSHDEYLEAAARAMSYEYKAITEAGFILQLDSPDLAMANHFSSQGSDLPEFHTHVRTAIAALNRALEGIDPARVRLHICWGNYPGPHHHDVELRDIIGELLNVNVKTLSFEAANPRHEHEWEVFRDVELPDDLVLMPGLIDVQTNRIEHPRLIAQRIERYADIVGPDRVLAATDCGLSTFAGWHNVDPEVGWAKLQSLVDGARLASQSLYARAPI